MIHWDTCGYCTKRVDHLASIPSQFCHILARFSASDSFVLKNSLNRLSCSECCGEGTTGIEEYALANQILKEQGVPGLHGPIGEEHIDLTWGIKVMCVRTDDGRKDIF